MDMKVVEVVTGDNGLVCIHCNKIVYTRGVLSDHVETGMAVYMCDCGEGVELTDYLKNFPGYTNAE